MSGEGGGHACDTACMWKLEDNWRELVLSVYHVGSRDGTQLVLLGDKHLYSLSHPDAYVISICFSQKLNDVNITVIPIQQMKTLKSRVQITAQGHWVETKSSLLHHATCFFSHHFPDFERTGRQEAGRGSRALCPGYRNTKISHIWICLHCRKS